MNEPLPADRFGDASFMQGGNTGYLEHVQARHAADPDSVDSAWAAFFQRLGEDPRTATDSGGGPSWARADWPPLPRGGWYDGPGPEQPATTAHRHQQAAALGETIKAKAQTSGAVISDDVVKRAVLDSIRALMLIRAYRIRGHLIADIDPLGLRTRATLHPELDPRSYGFDETEMDRPIFIDNVLGLEIASLRQIMQIVQRTIHAHLKPRTGKLAERTYRGAGQGNPLYPCGSQGDLAKDGRGRGV